MESKEALRYLRKIKASIQNNNLFIGITNAEDKKLQALDFAIKKIKESENE